MNRYNQCSVGYHLTIRMNGSILTYGHADAALLLRVISLSVAPSIAEKRYGVCETG